MRKMIASAMAFAATLGMTSVALPTAAHAQYVSFGCEAHSPTAAGVGISFDVPSACGRALAECSIRTPPGLVCVVTRWWVN